MTSLIAVPSFWKQRSRRILQQVRIPRLGFASGASKEHEPGDTVKEVKRLRKCINSSASSKDAWDGVWREGVTPWDLGKPTPLLLTELKKLRSSTETMNLQEENMFTLVPGCGSGHDLVTLADHHEEVIRRSGIGAIKNSVVVGLDISPTSLETAKKNIIDSTNRTPHTATRIELKCGDFFLEATDWSTTLGDTEGNSASISIDQFHFIFDYTFFCALPPELRQSWARRIKDLLIPTTGRLMTIIFPIVPDEDPAKGPPYPVTVDDYRSVLQPLGIEMESEPFESVDTVPSRAGKELVCYWRAKT